MTKHTETRLSQGLLRITLIETGGTETLNPEYRFTLDGTPITKDEALQLIDAELARRNP